MAPSEAVDVAWVDGLTSVIVRGDFDISSADTFASAVSKALVSATGSGHGDVEVDLSQVTFLDSAGISALVTVATAVRDGGHRFRVLDPTPLASRVIDICGLNDLFGLGTDEES